jgi:hypothetical protein
MTTPVFKALSLVLRGSFAARSSLCLDNGLVLIDYSCREAFERLWLDGLKSGAFSIAGQQIDLTAPTTQILLVGNDPPGGVFDTKIPALAGINFRNHFTATSWLAAWKVKFSPTQKEIDEKGAIEVNTRIAVIDPRPAGLATGVAQALQTIFSARNATGQPLVPGATVLNAPSLEAICQWLNPAKPDTRTLGKNALHLRELLKSNIWNELTSNREQHHALSNVLGAFLMPFQAAPWENPKLLDILKKEHPVAPFLLELVNACGGVAHVEKIAAKKEPEDSVGGEVEPDWWISEKLRESFSSAVLIDDISDIWGLFVQLALGFVDPKKRRVFTIPTENFRTRMSGLCDRLKKVIDSNESLRPGDLIGEEQQADPNFVIFLDLRLELGDKFQAQLEGLGKYLLNSKRNLPWLADQGKREELLAELESGKTNETLLPRLISLIDPTLPIIIFSSTHRRELIDPFRNYGNIITTFRKPIISGTTGDWKTVVEELRVDFGSAILQAERIIRVRRAFALISSRVLKVTLASATPEHKAVEVFIDESFFRATNIYAIGAVALSAISHSKIRDFCRELEGRGLQWGLSANNRTRYVSETRRLGRRDQRLECERRWYIDRRNLPRPEHYFKKMASAEEIADAWTRISALAQECEVAIHSVALGSEVSDEVSRSLQIPQLQGVGREQADELHRELSKSLLLSLFVAHPEISAALRAEGASLAVDLGTRTAVPSDYDNRFEDTYQSFGIGYTNHKLNVPTLEERCELWNQELEWAQNQEWWTRGAISARIVRGRIEPDERALSEWLDCHVWSPRRKMISVTSYDGLNYLRETLAALNPALSPNIVRARGCALFDFDDPRDWLTKLYVFPCFPYQPHYFADWIARSGVQQIGEPESNNSLTDAFTTGFVSSWYGAKQRLLHAVLRLDNNDESGGLKEILDWLEAERVDDNSGDDALVTLLLACGHRSALKASGGTLRRLFAFTG